MTVINTQVLVFYRLTLLTDSIPVGSNGSQVINNLFFLENNRLVSRAVYLTPGFYVPAVRDLVRGEERFVSAVNNFQASGITVVTKNDQFLGPIRVFQVTAPVGSGLLGSCSLTLTDPVVGSVDPGDLLGSGASPTVTYVDVTTISGVSATPINPTIPIINHGSFPFELALIYNAAETVRGKWRLKVNTGIVSVALALADPNDISFEAGDFLRQFTIPTVNLTPLNPVFSDVVNSSLPTSVSFTGDFPNTLLTTSSSRGGGFTSPVPVNYSAGTTLSFTLNNVVQSNTNITANLQLDIKPAGRNQEDLLDHVVYLGSRYTGTLNLARVS